MWPLACYAVLTGAALQASVAYLPMFAYDVLEWRVGFAGLTVSLVGAAGVCARILWGQWTESMANIGAPLVMVALGGAVAIALLLLAVPLEQAWLLWPAVILLGLTGVAANVVMMVVVVGLAPVEQLGRASGLLATGLFVGFALGPASFGGLVDASGGYSEAWAAVVLLYLLASALAVHIGYRHRPH